MRNAVSGMTMPMASEYPLVSHWPVCMVTPRSLAMGGSAVVSAVAMMVVAMHESMMLMKISVRRRLLSGACSMVVVVFDMIPFRISIRA